MITKTISTLTLAALFLSTPAFAGSHSKNEATKASSMAREHSDKTIPELLIADGRFTTLVAAVKTAGLVDTLAGKGPFTLFAPTDEAFAKLPPGTVDSLLKNIPKLSGILLYHVVPGAAVKSSSVKDGAVAMANGDSAKLSTKAGVKINNASVIEADWIASNGVVHVIDTVILPPSS